MPCRNFEVKNSVSTGDGAGGGETVDRENMVGVLMTKPGTNVEVLRPVSIIFIWSIQSQ